MPLTHCRVRLSAGHTRRWIYGGGHSDMIARNSTRLSYMFRPSAKPPANLSSVRQRRRPASPAIRGVYRGPGRMGTGLCNWAGFAAAGLLCITATFGRRGPLRVKSGKSQSEQKFPLYTKKPSPMRGPAPPEAERPAVSYVFGPDGGLERDTGKD